MPRKSNRTSGAKAIVGVTTQRSKRSQKDGLSEASRPFVPNNSEEAVMSDAILNQSNESHRSERPCAKEVTRATTVAPPLPNATSSRPATPRAILRAIGQAALPFIDAKGDDLRDDATPLDVYKAVAPFLQGYTVADAAVMQDIVRNAVNSDHGNGRAAARRSHALCETLWLLEGFVAHGRASGPDCVRARISVLKASLDDDGVLCVPTQMGAAGAIGSDVERLIEGRAFEGEAFDDPTRECRNPWLLSYFMEERHGLDFVAVRDAMGWADR